MVEYTEEPQLPVRICRPAFQDVHFLLPELRGRARLRRQIVKLKHWTAGANVVCDLDCSLIAEPDLYVASVSNGTAGIDGFQIVFCTAPNHKPLGMIWVVAVLAASEPFSSRMLDIIQSRVVIVKERSGGW